MVPYSTIPPSIIDSAPHRALALDAARQGIVLLTNPRSLLPLNRSSVRSVAVVGPNSNVSAFGNYAGTNDVFTTPLMGLQALFSEVTFSKGCNISDEDATKIPAAVAAAAAADVTIAVVGIDQSQVHTCLMFPLLILATITLCHL